MKFKIMLVLSTMLAASCNENLSTDEAVELASIYIDTAETQCNDDGLSVEEVTAYLDEADITIIDTQCGYVTGMNYPAVCGSGTNNIYIFTIQAVDLFESENLGFTDLSSLDSTLGYETVACL